MKNPSNHHCNASRRALLKNGVMLAAVGAAASAGLLGVSPAKAQSKASQATMMYQDKPHGSDACSNCIHYVAGKNPKSNGACTVVDGSISPSGWCVAFAAKS